MNSHKLIIMRHAKSDWSADAPSDFDRPLTKRGINSAVKMGTWLNAHKHIPDRIVSSPAVRAKMTADIVSKQFGKSKPAIQCDERIYDAGLDTLLNVIESHAKRARIVLLIGHNPGLDMLLDYLSSEEPKRNPKGKLLTTAAIAILRFRQSLINSKSQSAQLIKLVRPKDLK